MSSDSEKDEQMEPQMQSPIEKSRAEKVESLRSICCMSPAEFESALEEFDALVANRQSVSGSVLDRMVEELRSMKAMFAAVGMRRIEVVFDAVEQLRTLDTTVVHGWRVCALSGITTQRALRLSESMYVCTQYESWLRAVWLVTHLLFMEQQRLMERGERVVRVDRVDRVDCADRSENMERRRKVEKDKLDNISKPKPDSTVRLSKKKTIDQKEAAAVYMKAVQVVYESFEDAYKTLRQSAPVVGGR